MKMSFFKQWEYWPSFMFYIPLLPYAFYLAIKRKSFGFFSAVNPAIEESGNGLESKYTTLQLLPKTLCPKTLYIAANKTPVDLLKCIENAGISFPLIVKPDIGYRGLLVKKIVNSDDLLAYLDKYGKINLLVQELISLPNECGVFYHKIPGQPKGSITSLTLKKYLTVIGNGKSTLKSLILNDERAKRYLKILKDIHGNGLTTVPNMNEKVVLSTIGNHSKGTQFENGNNLICIELEEVFEKLQAHITGWYYGRIDLKYNSFEELKKGVNFKIIELNGIISEPTHIYDASKGNYFDALRSIKEHWKLVSLIAQKNKENNQGQYTDLKFLLNLYFRHKAYARKLKQLN